MSKVPPLEPEKEDEKPLPISRDMLVLSEQENLIDLEKGMSQLPLFTCSMVGILVVVFLFEVFTGALESAESIVSAGALYQYGVFHGEIWRLVTAIFLHGSWDHLIGNCIVFYILGVACEHIYGVKQTVMAFFFSGLCGSILSTLAHPGPGVGASGAIFGLMSMLVIFLWMHAEYFALRNKRIYVVLGVWALYSIGTGFMNPLIDNMAHVGGAFGGAVAVFIFQPLILKPTSKL